MKNLLIILKKRRDFLKTAQTGKRFFCPAFVGQSTFDEEQPARFGFTASRKLGGAVVRNRAKRRLKEAVRLVLRQRQTPPGTHLQGTYVIIAKPRVMSVEFKALVVWLNKLLETHASSQT